MALSKRKRLRDFFGALSKEGGEAMEKAIMERRAWTRKAGFANVDGLKLLKY
ncbi:hypothetical protein HY641_00320 [Candidatus Woesearchaeota archaeon]|nr:hypothetical protein [Candidatus Woesearchaeota archaeon]